MRSIEWVEATVPRSNLQFYAPTQREQKQSHQIAKSPLEIASHWARVNFFVNIFRIVHLLSIKQTMELLVPTITILWGKIFLCQTLIWKAMKLNQIMSAEFKSYFCIFGVSKHSVIKLLQKVSFSKNKSEASCVYSISVTNAILIWINLDFGVGAKIQTYQKVSFLVWKTQTTTFLK